MVLLQRVKIVHLHRCRIICINHVDTKQQREVIGRPGQPDRVQGNLEEISHLNNIEFLHLGEVANLGLLGNTMQTSVRSLHVKVKHTRHSSTSYTNQSKLLQHL